MLRREVRVESQLHVSGKNLVPLKTMASERVIPFAEDLVAVLDRRVAVSTKGWLFETANGMPYRASSAGAS